MLPGKGGYLLLVLEAEMEKRADTADISVLFFLDRANFLAVYAQTN